MPKEKSCGAIVFRRQKDGIKYLLLHYTAGHWDFPKGHQEVNETEQDAASREIKEETGLENIEFVKDFQDTLKYFYRKGEEVIYKEVIFFLVESKTEEIQLSFEHIGYAWMSYENAYKRLTFNTAKDLLRKANQFLYKNPPKI